MVSLTNLAAGVNGYVADTRTAEGGDDPTGTMTLRVPAASFDDVVGRVRAMGTVRSLTSHGQDVTGQYSDIKARLTALNATRQTPAVEGLACGWSTGKRKSPSHRSNFRPFVV